MLLLLENTVHRPNRLAEENCVKVKDIKIYQVRLSMGFIGKIR